MLMSKTTFESFADKMAKQAKQIKVCFDTLADTGDDPYYTLVSQSEHPDIELNMLQAAYTADDFFQSTTLSAQIKTMPKFTALVTAFEAALRADGTLSAKTWDGYCANQNVKVSDLTNQVYYAAKNNYMQAKNVWCEDELTMAECVMTNATTLATTPGAPLYTGTYSATQAADGSHFAPAALKVKVTGTQTIANLVVSVTGVGPTGTAGQSEQITVSGAPESYTAPTTAKFLSVTGVSRISGGTSGDSFTIVNSKERQI